MPTTWDRYSLTGAAAGVWLPGLFLLRYVAHLLAGHNGSGVSAMVGFGIGVALLLVLLRLVWWLPYRGMRAWMWASALALSLSGFAVWIGTSLSNSATVVIGDDLGTSALVGLGTGAPLALAYGFLSGALLGWAARMGKAQAGPSERPWALAGACGFLVLAGSAAIAYLIMKDSWPGPS